MADKPRIELSPGFHAEPGETPHHLHDIYLTANVDGNERVHCGSLSREAVRAWRLSAALAKAALAKGKSPTPDSDLPAVGSFD
jgi:hypothetical protein